MNPQKIKDIFNAYLISNAKFTEIDEYPIIQQWMVANEKPLNIIPFDKIRYVKDIENYYICFYCQDKEFNSVINNPQKYLSIFKRCKGLIGFDYSIHTDFPITLQKFLMFSNLSLTYYYGFNNIKVIPNIRYGLDETADEFLKAIPKNQLISIGTYGFCKTNEEKKRWHNFISKTINVLKPTGVIVYGPYYSDLFDKYSNIQFYHFNSWTNEFFSKREEIK